MWTEYSTSPILLPYHRCSTRITDPEILERRYPVVLRAFKLRHGSGGAGRWRGGDGVVRELQFRQASTVSILSERRAFAPYGMGGGHPGSRGVNTLIRAGTGARLGLGGKSTVDVSAGDRLRIESPGGGGYGRPAVEGSEATDNDHDGEYAYLVARALAGEGMYEAAQPQTSGSGSGSTVQADESSGAGAAFLFTGSVGRYKETQETV